MNKSAYRVVNGNKQGGRYTGTPMSAAKKAARRRPSLKIITVEKISKSNDGRTRHSYKVKRVKLKTPKVHPWTGKPITHDIKLTPA